MKTSNQSNTSNETPRTVEDIIRTIQDKSADGGYIFRGERRSSHTKVSSTLYRDFDGIDGFNIETIQKEMLNGAKKHTGHLPHIGDLPRDFRRSMAMFFNVDEELGMLKSLHFDAIFDLEIQHYGSKHCT